MYTIVKTQCTFNMCIFYVKYKPEADFLKQMEQKCYIIRS